MTGVDTLFASYERERRGAGIRPTTLKLQRDCVYRLIRFQQQETGGCEVRDLTRRLLVDFYAMRSERCASSTVFTDFKSIGPYLAWLVQEQELTSNPHERIKSPRQTNKLVPVFSEDDLRRLVSACSGNGRRDRRDMAAMRLLIEGLRRGEVCGLQVPDVELDAGLITVTGKGKTRTISIGSKTVVALDRWMRFTCQGGEKSSGTELFGLTPSGLYQAMRARAEAAGVEGFFPHRLRHTVAHRWLLADGGESALMQTMGWSSASMLRRYGASAAAERARAAQRHLGLSDRI